MTARALIGGALVYVIVLQALFTAVSSTTHAAAQALSLDSLAVICSSLNGKAQPTNPQSDPANGPRDHHLGQSTCCAWGLSHCSQSLAVATTFAYISFSRAYEDGPLRWICQDQTGTPSRFYSSAPPRAPPTS